MIRVLAVDDMPQNLALLRRLLGAQGFEVTAAPGAEEALAVAASGLPDIVLLDLRLGAGSITGSELARRLRGLPGGLDAVLLAMSGGGFPDEEDARRGEDFDGCIQKPFDPASLPQLLRDSLAARDAKSRPAARG